MGLTIVKILIGIALFVIAIAAVGFILACWYIKDTEHLNKPAAPQPPKRRRRIQANEVLNSNPV